MRYLVPLLWIGCKADQRVVAQPVETGADSQPSTPTDSGAPPSTTPPPADTATTPTPVDTSVPTTTTGSTTAPGARSPVEGELVIDELMIDPFAVGDEDGEWVELANISADPLDLTGLELADDDKDDALITELAPGSLVVEPGGYAVLCANGDPLANGGATCAGTYLYQGFGGGLALANTGDELEIRLSGLVIDRFVWPDLFAVPGESLGVDPSLLTEAGNDDPAGWCPQVDPMTDGDEGTPGLPNDPC